MLLAALFVLATTQIEPAQSSSDAPIPVRQSVAISDPASWIGPDDYPAAAITQQAEGRVTATYDIDTTGRIINCRVSGSSGFQVLDDATCLLLSERGRYSPAVDSQDRPIESSRRLTFSWQLPQTQFSERENWSWTMDITLTRDGTIGSCTGTGYHPFGMNEPCAQFRGYSNVRLNRLLPGGGAERRLMVTAARTFDGSPVSMSPVAGAELMTSGTAQFKLRSDGYVTSCETIRQEGSIELYHPCGVVGERFKPSNEAGFSDGSTGYAIWHLLDGPTR